MKIIHRLFQYLESKDVPHTRYEKEIGLSNGYLNTQLKRSADIGEGVIIKIIENSLDINPTWLLTGEGEMLRSTGAVAAAAPAPTAQPPPACAYCAEKDKVIRSQERHIDTLTNQLTRCQHALDQAHHHHGGQKRKTG